MTISADASMPIEHTDRFFIGGEWVAPSSGSTITVIDSHTEQAYVTAAEAQPAGIHRAVTAARDAFDHGSGSRTPSAPPTCGPWVRRSSSGRARSLREITEAFFDVDCQRSRHVWKEPN